MPMDGILLKETSNAADKINRRWSRHPLSTGCIMFTYADYKVILSIENHPVGRWKHASITLSRGGLPSWGDIKLMKDDFFGPEVYAIQILPPAAEYVNVHNYCMHLWQYLDDDKWPITESGVGND